jgi:HEAT repeat protein
VGVAILMGVAGSVGADIRIVPGAGLNSLPGRRLPRVAPDSSSQRALLVRQQINALLAAGRPDDALRAYTHLAAFGGGDEPALLREIAYAFIGEAIHEGSPTLRARAAKVLGAAHDPAAAALLRQALAHPDPTVRAHAARGLGRLRDTRSVERLQALLGDPQAWVRADAVGALVDLATPEARSLLTRALDDADRLVRVRAAEGLVALGGAGARGALVRALADSDPSIRALGAEALGRLRVGGAASALRRALADRDGSVAIAAAGALARLGLAEGSAWLRARVEDGRPTLRLIAAEELVDLGDPAAADLVAALARVGWDRRERLYLAWLMGRVGHPEAVDAADAFLRDRDPFLRRDAVLTLGEARVSGAAERLRLALGDPDRDVRVHATWALAGLVRLGRNLRETGPG